MIQTGKRLKPLKGGYMSGTRLKQADLREVVCYKCKKTGHIQRFCPLSKKKNDGGTGKDQKKSDGQSEKKKKKWQNSNPENKMFMEKNGKLYYWCKICNYGHGKWVDQKEEVCPYRHKQSSHETSTDSDDAGLMVMDLAKSGFLAIELL